MFWTEHMSLQAVIGVVMAVIAKWQYRNEPKTCGKYSFIVIKFLIIAADNPG